MFYPPSFFSLPSFQNDFVPNPLGGPGKVDVHTRVDVEELIREKKLFPWGSRGSPCGMTAWQRVSRMVSLEEVARSKVLEPDQNVQGKLMEEKFGEEY